MPQTSRTLPLCRKPAVHGEKKDDAAAQSTQSQISKAVIDETATVDYPNFPVIIVLVRCSFAVSLQSGGRRNFLERFLRCSKEHTIAGSFGLKMPAKR